MQREAVPRPLLGPVMIIIGIIIVLELWMIFQALRVVTKNQTAIAKMIKEQK